MASSGLDEPMYELEDDIVSYISYINGIDPPAPHSEDLTMDIHLLHEKYEDKPMTEVPLQVIERILDELRINLRINDALKRRCWYIEWWSRGKRRRIQAAARAAVDEEKMRSALKTLFKNSNSISEGWVDVLLDKWLAT